MLPSIWICTFLTVGNSVAANTTWRSWASMASRPCGLKRKLWLKSTTAVSPLTVTPRRRASTGIMETYPRLSSWDVGPFSKDSSVSRRGESLAAMGRITLFSSIRRTGLLS